MAMAEKKFDAGLSKLLPGEAPRATKFEAVIARIEEQIDQGRKRRRFLTTKMVEGTKAAEEEVT
ncbi:MAG: hypothetical protein AAB964_01650 [Patescibacteria group bacterium]